MAKKLIALVMVISVFGAFMAGCSKPAEEGATPKTEGAADKTGEAPKTP